MNLKQLKIQSVVTDEHVLIHQFTHFALPIMLKDYITYPTMINVMIQKMYSCNTRIKNKHRIKKWPKQTEEPMSNGYRNHFKVAPVAKLEKKIEQQIT